MGRKKAGKTERKEKKKGRKGRQDTNSIHTTSLHKNKCVLFAIFAVTKLPSKTTPNIL
jgi:hypothetical protein